MVGENVLWFPNNYLPLILESLKNLYGKQNASTSTKDAHGLIPAIWQYVLLYGKKDFEDIIKVTDLKKGNYSRLSEWVQSNHRSPKYRLSLAGDRRHEAEEVKEIQSVKSHFGWLENEEGNMMKNASGHRVERFSLRKARKEMGISTWNQILPTGLKESKQVVTLIPAV